LREKRDARLGKEKGSYREKYGYFNTNQGRKGRGT